MKNSPNHAIETSAYGYLRQIECERLVYCKKFACQWG